jgi:hypothetical protein
LNLKPSRKELDMIEYQAEKKPKKKIAKSETVEKINDTKIDSSSKPPDTQPEPEKPRLVKQASLPAEKSVLEEITTDLNQSHTNDPKQQQPVQENITATTTANNSPEKLASSDLNNLNLDNSKTSPKLTNGAQANLELVAKTLEKSSPPESSTTNLLPKSLLTIR